MLTRIPAPLCDFWQSLAPWQRWAFMAFLTLKLAWLIFLPLTGDEAYFIQWGQQLDWGYYDHPPMVGWFLGSLSLLADQLLLYRSLGFFISLLLAWVIYRLVRLDSMQSTQSALLIAAIFFVSPLSLAFSITANDTILVLFSSLAFLAYLKTWQKPSYTQALLTGLLLGAAFLSKYFAVFLYLGLLLHWLFVRPRLPVKYLLVILLPVLAAVAQNLAYNASHCWTNLLFNFFARVEASKPSLAQMGNYALVLFALFWPTTLYFYVKGLLEKTTAWTAEQKASLWVGLPFLILLIPVSYKTEIGLHWPLISVVILFASLSILSQAHLKKTLTLSLISGLLLGLSGLIALGWAIHKSAQKQDARISLYTQPKALCKALPSVDRNRPLFTMGYSEVAILAYHCELDNLHDFASSSKYGREDDKHMDFSQLNGQDLDFILLSARSLKKVTPYFAKTEVHTRQLADGTVFEWVIGKGFDFATYKSQVLDQVNHEFYTPPDWMKPFSQGCFFKDKYGFDNAF